MTKGRPKFGACERFSLQARRRLNTREALASFVMSHSTFVISSPSGLALLLPSSHVRGMEICVLPAGPIQTNAYLVLNDAVKLAVLIDAPHGVWPKVEKILSERKCRLEALFLT